MRSILNTFLFSASALISASFASACSSDSDDPAPVNSTGGAVGAGGGTTSAAGASAGTTSAAGAGGGTTSAAGAGGATSDLQDIVDTAVAAESFSTLVAAVQAAGLETVLRGDGPLTVFAPTDEAFAEVPKFLTDKLLTPPYKAQLGLILKYHVVAGAVEAADILAKTSNPETVLGATLSIDGSDGKVVINDTVNVTTPDVQASNGIIHVVDGVLLPTIAETAVGYDDGTTTFNTLVAALTAGELVAALGGPGPFTVFAPTDAAFAKIPKSTLDDLLLPANKAQLQTILKYHVVAGPPVYAQDVAEGTVTTLSGPVTVSVSDASVEIDAGAAKSKVVLTDLPASNGVIHVIDTVILPPS